jgi:hypothetical protein
LGFWNVRDMLRYSKIWDMMASRRCIQIQNIWDVLSYWICKNCDRKLECICFTMLKYMIYWNAGMYKTFWYLGMWDLLKCKRCGAMLASRICILMRECTRLAGILKCENYNRDVFGYWNV